jgi:hypothetical protein
LETCLRERLAVDPASNGRQLWREIKGKPHPASAQGDFARFDPEFLDAPGVKRID